MAVLGFCLFGCANNLAVAVLIIRSFGVFFGVFVVVFFAFPFGCVNHLSMQNTSQCG